MKNTMDERLVVLASAQERIMNIGEIISQLNQSQLIAEKNAYASMIASDKVTTLSKEGNQLAEKLKNYNNDINNSDLQKEKATQTLLFEVQNLFRSIASEVEKINEVSHNIEMEVALQKELGDNLRSSMAQICDSVDCMVACAELMCAEI